MKISIIGTGYVGLVTGACLSDCGMDVTCMDMDEEKIANLREGILPIHEPGLQEIVERNYQAARLKFTTNIQETVTRAEVIFITVGTPPQEDGSADLKHVKTVAGELAQYINGYKVIVSKSTVPVGTAKMLSSLIREKMNRLKNGFDFDVVANPEFLGEGTAVRDFMHPSRIVIGTRSIKAQKILKGIYESCIKEKVPFVLTNFETAELIKYASNAFLATKISFINEISNLCDKIGVDICGVSRAMGMDKRIGERFLRPGPGYGGSCLPKDTRALIKMGEESRVDMRIIKSVCEVNYNQKNIMTDKIERKLHGVINKVIGVLGLSFKPGTDDIRESPSIGIIKELLNRGASVKVYDPIAIESVRRQLTLHKTIKYCSDEYECARDADAIVLATEWDCFRNLDLMRMKANMHGKYFFDFRNVYDPKKVIASGFYYEGVGRSNISTEIESVGRDIFNDNK
ncbi:UDP-glucose dehydrogenase family protein [Ruminiclostridium josui]|uniref:UDP-glucose dehydrogenase family protein n=2 Tax=Ruminiclostridium josui TaxID=1499 RepID=UPI0004B6C1B6|nr:UDP-glucose/GDP-mannose dehydrogenase family protein [Ruminiclostridium josui]